MASDNTGDEDESPKGAGFGGGLRGLAKRAKESPLAHKAADAASSAGRVAAEAARNVEARKAVMDAAAPTVTGALDGAKLRNKKGKIKVWRVARAAARPRKNLTRATQGAASASSGQIRSVLDGTRAADKRTFSDAQILAEWTLDGGAARWEQGVALFEEAGNAEEARSAAELLCVGLASCLTDTPLIADDDLAVEAMGDVLAIVLGEENPRRWDADERRLLRVALAVARLTGTQPESLSGNGELDVLFESDTARMRAALAISTTGWPADLPRWFGA